MYDRNITFSIRGRAIPITIDAFSPWTQWQVEVYYSISNIKCMRGQREGSRNYQLNQRRNPASSSYLYLSKKIDSLSVSRKFNSITCKLSVFTAILLLTPHPTESLEQLIWFTYHHPCFLNSVSRYWFVRRMNGTRKNLWARRGGRAGGVTVSCLSGLGGRAGALSTIT